MDICHIDLDRYISQVMNSIFIIHLYQPLSTFEKGGAKSQATVKRSKIQKRSDRKAKRP
jgi:hypothetical protein